MGSPVDFEPKEKVGVPVGAGENLNAEVPMPTSSSAGNQPDTVVASVKVEAEVVKGESKDEPKGYFSSRAQGSESKDRKA